MLDQRYDLCGITVHFVDPGVDTGDIVLQRHQTDANGLDPYMLRMRNVIIARELLPMQPQQFQMELPIGDHRVSRKLRLTEVETLPSRRECNYLNCQVIIYSLDLTSSPASLSCL